MAATAACSRTLTLPFLEGTVPPVDNTHTRGCLDIVPFVEQATPDRPEEWVDAAYTWSQRLGNGQTGAIGDPEEYRTDPAVRFAFAPLNGETGWPIICYPQFRPPSDD